MIDGILLENEKVIARAEKNPVSLILPGAITALGFFGGLFAYDNINVFAGIFGAFLFALITGSLRAFASFYFDELVITDRRVYGRSLVKLTSVRDLDIPVEKISSLSVSQGFLGKTLGYSTVSIQSYGEGWKFRTVKNSREMRKAFYDVRGSIGK